MPPPSSHHDPPPSPPPAAEEETQEDVEAVDESTPFLPSANNPPTSPPSFPKTIHTVTALSLTFSILALVSLFATAVADHGPVAYSLPWSTQEGLKGVVAPAIFSLLFSAYNLRRIRSQKPAAPLAINLIVDVVIAFFALAYGAGGLSGLLDGQGGWCMNPVGRPVSCGHGELVVKVFAGIAVGAGIVFGAMHFVLFCVRCRIAYSAGLGRFPWVLPVGQLEFKVSIKFLREPEREGEAREGTV